MFMLETGQTGGNGWVEDQTNRLSQCNRKKKTISVNCNMN